MKWDLEMGKRKMGRLGGFGDPWHELGLLPPVSAVGAGGLSARCSPFARAVPPQRTPEGAKFVVARLW